MPPGVEHSLRGRCLARPRAGLLPIVRQGREPQVARTRLIRPTIRGKATCPTCNKRCAELGRTGLRVCLDFSLRGGGGTRPPRSARLVVRCGGEGRRRRNFVYPFFA